MANAVIVVGSHYAGKSRTINEFLKPELGIGRYVRKFIRRKQNGLIRSQSLEETNIQEEEVADVVERLAHYDLLVFAARPANEKRSYLNTLTNVLKVKGFTVSHVDVVGSQLEQYYKEKANDILQYLDA